MAMLENDQALGQSNDLELLEAQSVLGKAIDMEENYLQQKAALNKFQFGDRNTRYFHAMIKYKRQLNAIVSITDDQGNRINDPQLIAQSAVTHYQSLLTASTNDAPPQLTDVF